MSAIWTAAAKQPFLYFLNDLIMVKVEDAEVWIKLFYKKYK